MRRKEIIPERAIIIIDGERILAALKHRDAKVWHAFVLGVPITIYEHMNKYYGRYNIDEREIKIDIPANWHDADKPVVLFILLHEIAHHKQRILARENFFCLQRFKTCAEDQKGLLPTEVAANKHAVRAMLKMGIPPSAIDASLNSAFGPEAFTRTGHKYRQYRWIGRYFRARTSHTS